MVGQLSALRDWLPSNQSLTVLAEQLGLEHGISGYCLHTTIMVTACVLKYYHSPAEGLEELIRCGGDTDTTAIAGGILGARNGPDCWPDDWVNTIHNGPLSTKVLLRAADQLACKGQQYNGGGHWFPLRNGLFFY